MSNMHHRRAGYPFGTLVDFAADEAGYPIFCLSPLAIHTRNIMEDPRCSLVVQMPGWTGALGAVARDVVPLWPLCAAGRSRLGWSQPYLPYKPRIAMGSRSSSVLLGSAVWEPVWAGVSTALFLACRPGERARDHLRRRVPAAQRPAGGRAGDLPAEAGAARGPCVLVLQQAGHLLPCRPCVTKYAVWRWHAAPVAGSVLAAADMQPLGS